MPQVRRGEVWFVDLDEPGMQGHEQQGYRPALVVSIDRFNLGPAELVVIVPMTTRVRVQVPLHVPIDPPEGGLKQSGSILCDQIRTIALGRFRHRTGTVSAPVMAAVEARLRALLALP